MCNKSLSFRPQQLGFSLVEMLITVGLTSIVLLATAVVALTSTTTLASITNYLELNEQNRLASGQIAKDLRACTSVTSYTTNGISVQAADGSTISYVYNPSSQTLTRTKGSDSDVVLEGCSYIEFLIHQRTPKGSNYEVYVTADVDNTKVVKANWSCTKMLSGIRGNTENMTTGYIVIRSP